MVDDKLWSLLMHIGGFLSSMPEAAINPVGELEARRSDLAFSWDYPLSGSLVDLGGDYIEFDSKGLMEAIQGYWDPFENGASIERIGRFAQP